MKVAVGLLLMAVLIMKTGEDVERFLTDVKREEQHPSLAHAGRVLGDTARLMKDWVGLSEA